MTLERANLAIRCVSIGPRSGGRDYGLLSRFRDVRVSGRAGAVLADFALALLKWGQTGGRDFALFLPLEAAHSLYLLARVAHLRSESLGPVVLANGLLLDHAALDWADWRPHRLLPALRSPRSGEWDRREIEVAPVTAPSASSGALADLGMALPQLGNRLMVVTAPGDSSEAVATEILDSAHNLPGLYPSWCLASGLPRVERFDPSRFELIVAEGDPDAAPPDAYRVVGGRLDGPALPRSQAWRIWEALFLRALAGQRELIEAAAATAPRYGVDARTSAVAGIHAVLRHSRLDETALWSLFKLWSDTAAALTAEDGAEAEAAVAMAVRQLVEQQASEAAKAALLQFYLRELAPRLKRVSPMLPAGIAAEHGLLPALATDDLRRLIAPGLSRALARALVEQEIAGAEPAADRLAVVAGAIRLPEQGGAPAELLELAEAVVAAALKTLAKAKADPNGIGELALPIAERLLLAKEAEWSDSARVLADLWKAAPSSPTRRAIYGRLYAAPMRFWRRPDDRSTRRLMGAALHLVERRELAA